MEDNITVYEDFQGKPPLLSLRLLNSMNDDIIKIEILIQDTGGGIAMLELPDGSTVAPPDGSEPGEMEIVWETAQKSLLVFTAFAKDRSSTTAVLEETEGPETVMVAPMSMSFSMMSMGTANYSLEPSVWTTGEVAIRFSALSGTISKIFLLPDNIDVGSSQYKVSQNGSYQFRVEFSDGSSEEITAAVSNIDKEPNSREINMLGGSTAQHWESSAIREFLNSDQVAVKYTMKAPPYATEPGFLSVQNFTESEKSGIAAAGHNGGSLLSTEGNISSTQYLSLRSVESRSWQFRDKVFILNSSDIIHYIEKNNKLMEMNKKYYSDAIRNETSLNDKYSYTMNIGAYHSSVHYYNRLFTTLLESLSAGRGAVHNIVPALFLKPDFVLTSTGSAARNLLVGSLVTFGKYQGDPITWRVIYKSESGYPLLWSEKILMRKAYSMEDVILPKETSDYINFPITDLSIQNNNRVVNWITQEAITSVPVVTILNPEVALTPTNEDHITLQIRASDAASGIKKLVLPDREVLGDSVDWILTKNGEYTLYAESNSGVITPFHIVTRAINVKAQFNVTTNQSGGSTWTNKPVIATASSSHEGVYVKELPESFRNWNSASTSHFPAWLPIGGKNIRVTGTLRHNIPLEALSEANLSAPINIRLSHMAYTLNRVYHTYPSIAAVTLGQLVNNGDFVIDTVYKAPDNVYQSMRGSVDFGGNSSVNYRYPHMYWMSNFRYEILEQDDFKINSIVLPDGSVVSKESATYEITTKGRHTFKAYDTRGMEYISYVDVDIDMEKPSLEVSNITPESVRTTTLRVIAVDKVSGIKKLVLPNGESRENAMEGQGIIEDYNISANGTYSFTAYDFAGNATTTSFTVDNVFRTPPVLTLQSSNTSWTRESVTITARASSDIGVAGIFLPTNEVVSSNIATYVITENGTYLFKAVDSVGNITTEYVVITNIDKTPPTLEVYTEPKLVAGPIPALIEAESMSGIQAVYMNGVLQLGTPMISRNGTYTFKVVSRTGLETTKVIVVGNIIEDFLQDISMARVLQKSKTAELFGLTPGRHLTRFRSESSSEKLQAGFIVKLLKDFFKM